MNLLDEINNSDYICFKYSNTFSNYVNLFVSINIIKIQYLKFALLLNALLASLLAFVQSLLSFVLISIVYSIKYKY